MSKNNKSKAGQPKKQTTIIEINNIKLEFIITKTDNHNNDISYLKVIDRGFKNKLAPIVSQMCDDCILPIWKSEDGFYMLKVKNKWMPERDFEKNEILTAGLNFQYYTMSKEDGDLLQGFYLKISTNDVVCDY